MQFIVIPTILCLLVTTRSEQEVHVSVAQRVLIKIEDVNNSRNFPYTACTVRQRYAFEGSSVQVA